MSSGYFDRRPIVIMHRAQYTFLGVAVRPNMGTDMDRFARLVTVGVGVGVGVGVEDDSASPRSLSLPEPAPTRQGGRRRRRRRSRRSFLRSSMRSRTSTQSAFQFSMLRQSSGSASAGRTNSWQSVSTARIVRRRCRSSDSLASMSSSLEEGEGAVSPDLFLFFLFFFLSYTLGR